MHKSLKKLLIYQNQSLKVEKSAKKSFFYCFVLDLHNIFVHQYFPQMLFLRSCALLVLINKKITVEFCNQRRHLQFIFIVKSSWMNNKAAILKIQICILCLFGVYLSMASKLINIRTSSKPYWKILYSIVSQTIFNQYHKINSSCASFNLIFFYPWKAVYNTLR